MPQSPRSTFPALCTPHPLRIAFLGGAINSAVGRAHQAATTIDRRFNLVAGAFSRDSDINLATATDYGVTPDRTYAGLEQLLAAEAGNLDAVVILTPTDAHREHVLACITAGIPVICEKALAGTLQDCRDIADHLANHQGYLAVTFNYTGYPMIRELQRMIEAKRLGRLQQIHVEMPQEGFLRRRPDGSPMLPQAWRLRDGPVPTVSLDLGVHVHSLVHFLTGAVPAMATGSSASLGNFTGIIDNVSCLVHYDNGMLGDFWWGKCALGYRNGLRIRVFGTDGSAEWVQEEPEILRLSGLHGERMLYDRTMPDIEVASANRYSRFKAGHPAGFIEAFANYYGDIADSLEARRLGHVSPSPYVLGVEAATEGLAMLEAVATASVGTCWMQVKR